MTCDDIDEKMERVQACDKDADCVFSDIRSCRFPCGMAHNKGYDEGEVQAIVTEWDSCHEWSCPAHGCPELETVRPACIDNTCQIRTTQESGEAEATCTDSDGGKDYYVRGVVSPKCVASCGAWIDSCKDNETLIEYFCKYDYSRDEYDFNTNFEEYHCPGGCENGRCI